MIEKESVRKPQMQDQNKTANHASSSSNAVSSAQKQKNNANSEIPDQKISSIRENEIKDLLAKSEISLSLDNYDDIFSDFDPRPYSERALSDDFLNESRKAARERPKSVSLNFLIPEHMRNPAIEQKIKRRLKEHFKKHHFELEAEEKKILGAGIAIAFFGFTLMMIATYLYDMPNPGFLLLFLRTMIEPSGWFMVWFGLDQIFYTRNQHKPEREFYSKMTNASIVFSSY